MEELNRTHLCGQVSLSHLGQQICVKGWVNIRRDHGGVIFIDLRDGSGFVQAVFDVESNAKSHKLAEALRNEFVVGVQGELVKRSPENVNPSILSGEVEIKVQRLVIYNTCDTLPFQVNDDVEISEKLRLEYRYLDMRQKTLTHNLRLRSKAAKVIRDFLHEEGFHEVETPFLTKSTPEGARDYLVPSRVNPGKFYALPQSPQLFKQILMMGGMDRYYQIARCFRDEDLRGNRQPEFTQIDMELTFTSQEEVIEVCSRLIRLLFKETIGADVALPIQRITYNDAMNFYGSDAPDMRFELKLIDLCDVVRNSGFQVFDKALDAGGIVKALMVKGGADFSRKELDDLTELAKTYNAKGMAWVKITEEGWQSPIAKFLSDGTKKEIQKLTGAELGDLILFGADTPKIVFDALGNIRKDIGRRKNLIDDSKLCFAWVTDFPMFDKDADGSYAACHHPFTRPNMEDFKEWSTQDLSKIKAQAYDLVLNGVELGGGSIRIHDSELQSQIFRILKLTEEDIQTKFGFLIKALRFGAPPHGGIAFGFDRLMMFLCGANSIRDVIAFPKTQQASCLMTDAPSEVSTTQLKELKISLKTI